AAALAVGRSALYEILRVFRASGDRRFERCFMRHEQRIEQRLRERIERGKIQLALFKLHATVEVKTRDAILHFNLVLEDEQRDDVASRPQVLVERNKAVQRFEVANATIARLAQNRGVANNEVAQVFLRA